MNKTVIVMRPATVAINARRGSGALHTVPSYKPGPVLISKSLPAQARKAA